MHIAIALFIVLISTLLMFKLSKIAKTKIFFKKKIVYINFQFVYQTGLLLLALMILFLLYLFYPVNFEHFINIGDLSAPAKSVSWLGIEEDETWLSLGLSLSFFITAITATFIYFQFKKSNISFKAALPYLPWIILFSLTNSFSEEVIYRFGIIIPLYGSIDTNFILLISAIAFGLPHLKGMPSGTIGVVMASLLGWLLAKSVIETNGYFWAWGIHFAQDIVIISALLLSSITNDNKYEEHNSLP